MSRATQLRIPSCDAPRPGRDLQHRDTGPCNRPMGKVKSRMIQSKLHAMPIDRPEPCAALPHHAGPIRLARTLHGRPEAGCNAPPISPIPPRLGEHGASPGQHDGAERGCPFVCTPRDGTVDDTAFSMRCTSSSRHVTAFIFSTSSP